MRLIDPSDVARRARAALAYANIDVKSSPQHTGISYATMQRIVSPTAPRGAKLEELWAIADATGVPRNFMEHGFEGLTQAGEDTAAARLEALEEEQRQIRDQLAELVKATRRTTRALLADGDPEAAGDTPDEEGASRAPR